MGVSWLAAVFFLGLWVNTGANLRRQHYGDYLATTGCPSVNHALMGWIADMISSGSPPLPQSTDFDSFVEELKHALEQHHLPVRALDYLFSESSPVQPTCSGQWLEFGVFGGASLNVAAEEKLRRCGRKCPPVFGFDTFTGLPEAWQRDDVAFFGEHSFDQGGNKPQVATNAELIQGLFIESIPKFLDEQAVFTGYNQTISYIHIDCDLYAGSRDALTILDNAIRPGTVMLFDDLVNYPKFREHELKAFWEWLEMSGAKVLPIGILGPIPSQSYAVDLDIKEGEHPWFHQSAAFVVASRPEQHKLSYRQL